MKQATRLLQMPLQSIWADNREATREEDTRGWRRVGLGKHLRKGRSFVGLNSWDSGARRSQGTGFKSMWFISIIIDMEADSLAKFVWCPISTFHVPELCRTKAGSRSAGIVRYT
jgi:hypothetical protein